MNSQLISRILALNLKSVLIVDADVFCDELIALSTSIGRVVVFSRSQFYMKKMRAMVKNRNVFFISSEEEMKNRNFDCVIVGDVILSYESLKNVGFARIISQKDIPIDIPGFKKVSSHEFVKTELFIDFEDPVSIKKDIFCSFFTVNYNTSKLINILIQSIHKYVKSFNYDIWVFDNSDKEKLELFEEWPDVHIIDNTKGQVVDYAKELPKYCDMHLPAQEDSFAGFISFKHALAIEAGLNDKRISDNFILCDSDVILTKDVDFIDDTKISIGSVRVKRGDYNRVVPFLNYINRKLMRQCGIKYLDYERFHGCLRTVNGRRVTGHGYDTGSSFYLDIMKKAPYMFINLDINKYCIHLGGSSRNDKWVKRGNYDLDKICEENGFIQTAEPKDKVYHFSFSNGNDDRYKKIIKLFSQTKSDKKKKYCIYTAITGGYDKIHELGIYEDDIDYICFTDSDSIKSDNWRIVDIKELYDVLEIKNPQLLARFIKTHPHLLLKNYKKSIWIDGNIETVSNSIVEEFIPMLGKDEYILMKKHPKLVDVFGEIDACINMHKDTRDRLEKMRKLLQIEDFNDAGKHVETNVILRDHQNEECKFLMEQWWQMILKYTVRDQVTFNYVFWRFNGRFAMISNKEMKSRFFATNYMHQK